MVATHQAGDCVLAAQSVRVFRTIHPHRIKRAQGRPGAGWHPWPACNKKHAVRTTGSAERTRPSLRNGFNGFLRALSGEPGFLATVARKMRKHLCGLSASVGAPRPHDFAVRDKIIRLVI